MSPALAALGRALDLLTDHEPEASRDVLQAQLDALGGAGLLRVVCEA